MSEASIFTKFYRAPAISRFPLKIEDMMSQKNRSRTKFMISLFAYFGESVLLFAKDVKSRGSSGLDSVPTLFLAPAKRLATGAQRLYRLSHAP